MRRFNLYENSADLKIKLGINKFFGEASFTANGNIAPGQCIPVLLLNDEYGEHLRTMKWGIDIFNNGGRILHNARSEGITTNNAWSPLIERGQRCIIICKGFYIWQSTEILDPIRRKTMIDKQPYYISPNKLREGEFFYIAGLYKVTKSFRGTSYSVVTITEKAPIFYSGYGQERIPLLLKGKKERNKWLNARQSIFDLLNNNNNNNNNIHHRINTNPFLKIGLWVNSPDLYKNENVILQSRFQWNLEKEAKIIFDEIEFDEIEKEALKQNEANKLGLLYKEKNNWDNLKEQNKDNLDEDEEEEDDDLLDNLDNLDNLDDNDKELKQEEEYNDNDKLKRKRKKRSFEFNDDDDDDDDDNDNFDDIGDIGDIQEPPNKKQKLLLNHKKPIRRHSDSMNDLIDGNHLKSIKKKNDEKRLSTSSH